MTTSDRKPPLAIDRRHLLHLFAAAGYTAASLSDPAAAAAVPKHVPNKLLGDFRHPAGSANLGAYWYWLGGNVTAEGITADLEAMHEAGITQPMLFSIGKGGPVSPIKPSADALTDTWWALVEHAVHESERLGLTLALNACDGWATASGPWITPELSMQHVVWSEQRVKGGTWLSTKLPVPEHLHDYYRDVAVLALPYPEEWDQSSAILKPKITTNLPLKVGNPAVMTDPANKDEVVDCEDSGWIVYDFGKPFTLRSVTVHTPSPWGYSPGVYRAANSLEVQASDDGVAYRSIGHLEYPKHGWQTDLNILTHAVPQTKARYFRLLHHKFPADLPYEEEYDFGQDTRLRFYSIVLSSEPRIHHAKVKSGEQWAVSRETTAADVPVSACVMRADIIDLTSRLSSNGSLNWNVPKGRWRILRMGYTTTGTQNSAAGGAQGLECDRFNADTVKLQFDNWFAKALAKVGPRYAGKVLHVIHVDSWEAGAQNWSPGFAEQFRKLRGYDLMSWLPAMAGIPLDSIESSERVLFDLRRTVNDLTSQNFFKTIADLAHANGCVFSAEPPNPTFFCDGLEYASYADLPMGEFWLNTPRNDKPNDVKDAVSGARIYGKPVAATESFTEGLMDWRETPFAMKVVGDHHYCEGVNRFMLHVYAQQPWLDRAPGMTLNGIGSFVSRTQTWWKPGQAWLAYMRRCQALLQAGSAMSDICVFTGENIPARAVLPRNLSQAIPPGYSYDSINRDALLRLTRVENGDIVLESGMHYRLLLLPDERSMTPQLAEKIRDLVLAGATIVGPRPERSPSKEFGAAADERVRTAAAELWGDLDGKAKTERKAGLGRVIWGQKLQEVLHALTPDVKILPQTAALEWVHRRGPDWDLYFISNQSDKAVRFEAAFRVTGCSPELWHPDTGARQALAHWRPEKHATVVPLTLGPGGSIFVVFGKDISTADPIIAVETGDPESLALLQDKGLEAVIAKPGQWRLRHLSGKIVPLAEQDPLTAIAVAGPWQLRFADRLPAPVTVTLQHLASWTEQKRPEIKYYSGTATYRTSVQLAHKSAQRRYLLDLGTVHDLAEVRVNGQKIGTLWKPPYSLDVTAALRPGSNLIEVDVTNTWNNRLIGDDGKPENERVSFVVPMLRKNQPWLPAGDDKLTSAGLLGPVQIKPLAVWRR